MRNPGSRIALLEAEPELARFMTPEEREAAAKSSVPITRIPRGPVELPDLLDTAGAFGALVLDGMLFGHHRVGEHAALRLLGPGDLLALPGSWSSVLPETTLSVAAPATLALFGTELLLAARRWPRIVAGFHVRVVEQAERVAAQLVICQLPRVDQRLLAIMWLLAESWGHVTPAGTRLPLNLTHDAFGALIGARRPTVTLALGELMERGAIVRQDQGWLLLEAPVEQAEAPPSPPDHEVLIETPPSAWEMRALASPTGEDAHEQLLSTVRRLRAEHVARRERVRSRLEEMADRRTRNTEARRRITADAVKRRQAPS